MKWKNIKLVTKSRYTLECFGVPYLELILFVATLLLREDNKLHLEQAALRKDVYVFDYAFTS